MPKFLQKRWHGYHTVWAFALVLLLVIFLSFYNTILGLVGLFACGGRRLCHAKDGDEIPPRAGRLYWGSVISDSAGRRRSGQRVAIWHCPVQRGQDRGVA